VGRTVAFLRYERMNSSCCCAGYMLIHPLSRDTFQQMYPNGRKYLFDLGTGRYLSGSLPWFNAIYSLRGIEFDEVWGEPPTLHHTGCASKSRLCCTNSFVVRFLGATIPTALHTLPGMPVLAAMCITAHCSPLQMVQKLCLVATLCMRSSSLHGNGWHMSVRRLGCAIALQGGRSGR